MMQIWAFYNPCANFQLPTESEAPTFPGFLSFSNVSILSWIILVLCVNVPGLF